MCNRGCSKLEMTVNDQSQNSGTNEKKGKRIQIFTHDQVIRRVPVKTVAKLLQHQVTYHKQANTV